MSTSNVIQFSARPVTAKQALKAVANTAHAMPEMTQWDKDFAEYGDLPEYTLCATLLAMSWAYQTGKIALGDKFLATCRQNGWGHSIPLGKELGDALNEADFAISTGGTEDQRNVGAPPT